MSTVPMTVAQMRAIREVVKGRRFVGDMLVHTVDVMPDDAPEAVRRHEFEYNDLLVEVVSLNEWWLLPNTVPHAMVLHDPFATDRPR